MVLALIIPKLTTRVNKKFAACKISGLVSYLLTLLIKGIVMYLASGVAAYMTVQPTFVDGVLLTHSS